MFVHLPELLRIQVDVAPGRELEAEPEGVTGLNDTSAAAQSITPGAVRGWHGNNEVDLYSFVVPAPAIVRFETIAYRNGAYAGGTAYYDPLLRLVRGRCSAMAAPLRSASPTIRATPCAGRSSPCSARRSRRMSTSCAR